MSEKLEELISLLYQDKLTQYGKRLLVENIEKLQKENEEYKKAVNVVNKEKEDWIRAYQEEKDKQFDLINKTFQKVKDKIEELKQEKKKYGNCLIEMYEDELVNRDIKILKELLEGRK